MWKNEPCKTVLITGASSDIYICIASSGLGEHFARLSARAGANVIIAARRFAKLQELAAELKAIPGVEAHQRFYPVVMDVTDVESIRTAFAKAEAEMGPANVIVNNSGIANPKFAVQMEVEDW